MLLPSRPTYSESLQVSLPLVRGYVRDLEARGCIKRERFYRRGPRLLGLTDKGKELVRQVSAGAEAFSGFAGVATGAEKGLSKYCHQFAYGYLLLKLAPHAIGSQSGFKLTGWGSFDRGPALAHRYHPRSCAT